MKKLRTLDRTISTKFKKLKLTTSAVIQMLNMLRVKILITDFQYHQVLSERGLKQEECEVYKMKIQEDIDIVLKTYKSVSATQLLLKKLEKLYCMLEFLVESKLKTFNVRLSCLREVIQILRYSKTLEVGSITTEALSEYLSNKSYSQKLGQLWLPTGTDCSDSALSSLSNYVTTTEQRSSHYFKRISHPKRKLETTSLQFAPISQQKLMENEAASVRTRIRKLKLTPFQTIQFNNYFCMYNYIYNLCVDTFYSTPELKYKGDLEPVIVSKNNNKYSSRNSWKLRLNRYLRPIASSVDFLPVAACVKTKAAEEFIKNVVAADKKASIHKLQYKNKRFHNTFGVGHRELNRGKTLFTKELSLGTIIDTKGKRITSECDMTFTKDSLGDIYALLPEKVQNLRCREPNTYNRVCALDPGVRKFMVSYNPLETRMYGEYTLQKLKKLCTTLDYTVSNVTKERSKKRRKYMRIAAIRIRKRIRNLRNDFHKKVAKDLTDNYDIVLLPHFATKSMLTSLNSKSARQMCNWAHFSFKTYLKYKCRASGVTLAFVSERFTSKTCGNCGNVKKTKDCSELYCCKKCGVSIDRDIMASRNIFIKNLMA